MDTISLTILVPPPRRRTYSAEFKATVLDACRQSGVSIAAIARQHNLNDNLVHKWLRKASLAQAVMAPALPAPAHAEPALEPANAFLPIHVPDLPLTEPASIRLRLRQGGKELQIDWPVGQAQACLALVQVLLR